jgi:O-antigen/teichoic acid export membrane protein
MTESVAGVAVAPSTPRARIARAFSIQLICRVLGMLASVVSVAIAARYLGPGRYGQLTIAVVFMGTWVCLADLSISHRHRAPRHLWPRRA